MTRRRAHAPLNVFLNSRLVGVLRRESTGAIDFQYAKDWLAWENAFAVSLSLPLREDRYALFVRNIRHTDTKAKGSPGPADRLSKLRHAFGEGRDAQP